MTPLPRARRELLLRRVYLDLIGLPPTRAQLHAFLKDPSSDAYRKVVDQLLNSKHYGERWGRHWLDQARYADSHGYTNDNERTMWPYRDWVIAAFNQDMPFDQFTITQFVKDANSLSLLWGMGVNFIQGYFLQEPQPDMNYDFTGIAG